MSKAPELKEKISIDNLVKGLYVDLELPWTKHPFTFARFKIKSNKDILAIKSLGLAKVTVIPERSDVEIPDKTVQHEPIEQKKVLDDMWQSKNEKIMKASHYRDKRKKIIKRYHEQARKVKKITGEIKHQPANAIHNVDNVVKDLASIFNREGDILINLINLGSGDHSDYNHAINVTMLSLMLGSEEHLSKDELQQLGVGALLHDIGKIDVPGSITMKKTKLTLPEENIFQQHPASGLKLVGRVRKLDTAVLEIIEYHHEFLDGTGYPHQLMAPKLSKLVRIISVANIYDNFCNPPDPAEAVTPKTALAMMYSKYKDKLDRQLVEKFIHILGIYPPGTIVRLDDDSIGLVIASNSNSMLQPEVLLYNPDIPKEQALTINLKENNELTIKDVLRPDEYPSQVYEYLGIKERLGYLIENTLT